MKLSNLTDTQYLTYYNKRVKKSIDDYEIFISNLSFTLNEIELEFMNKVFQTYYIDIRPYLYTINNITTREYVAFLNYLHHYLWKVEYNDKEMTILYKVKDEIDISKITNIKGFMMLLKCSNLMMVTVLFLMQYYFL